MTLSPRIADNPLLAELPAVERAKLLAELEERRYAPGEIIFRAGAPGDALYLLVEGAVEVRTGPAGAPQAAVVVLQAPDYFGEQALLTGDPRTTTVVAASDVLVARLPRPRFDALLARNPTLALLLGRGLSRRLAAARRAVSEVRHGFEELVAARLDAMAPERRDFLLRTAILRRLEPAVVDGLLGTTDAGQRLAELAAEGAVITAVGEGRYAYHPLWANFLRARLRAEGGPDRLRELHAAAAAIYAARGDWGEAAYHYRAAGEPAAAEPVLAAAGRDLLARLGAPVGVGTRLASNAWGDGTRPPGDRRGGDDGSTEESGSGEAALRSWLAAVSAGGLPRSPELLALALAAYRRLGDAAGEQRTLEATVAAPPAGIGRGGLAACYERLAALAADRDDRASASRYLALARALGADLAQSAEPAPPPMAERADGSVAASGLALAADRAFWLAAGAARGLGGPLRRRLIGLTLAALVGAVFVLVPAPSDLAPPAWTALGLVAIFVPILVFEVVPDYVAGLLLVAAWAALGVVPARVALAGYASGTWLLVVAVLGLGAAVARSGLLYRAALLALTHLPSTHAAQSLALGALGLAFTPGMPNATARTAMAAPLVAEIADALGYRPGSRARAGLAIAALFGFGQMAGLFLTGSSTGLLVHGVLPPEVRAQATWGAWFQAALPLHVAIALVGFGAAVLLYRPRQPRQLARERLALQRRLLGPPSRAEWLTFAIFVLVLVGFVTQPLHHVDPAWVGLLGLCLLIVTGALDQNTFRNGVNWGFLLYLGVLIGLGDVFVYLQLDAWLASQLAGLLAPLAGSALAFTLGLALVSFAISLVVRWQAAGVLLTLVLGPVALALGISPWVVGLIALTATNTFFLPYQSTIYLALYYGMGESFAHADVRPVAWAYAGAVLVGIALSLPFWRAMGLLG